MVEEMLDLLDANGNHLGKIAPKTEAHLNGWFHATVHIWFFTGDGRVLIQQRGMYKDTFPSLWDVSVAGHVSAGEALEQAAIREVKEEIGLDITEGEIIKIGVFKSVHQHSNQLKDHEFNHTYICLLNTAIENLREQKSEVAALRLISLTQLAEETWGLAKTNMYVPHGPEYYATIIKAIKKRL